jgi:hypothetical protein
MKLWTLIKTIILWPGRAASRQFPDLDPEHSRLLHNMVNYIVWLTLIIGYLIYYVIASMPPPGPSH